MNEKSHSRSDAFHNDLSSKGYPSKTAGTVFTMRRRLKASKASVFEINFQKSSFSALVTTLTLYCCYTINATQIQLTQQTVKEKFQENCDNLAMPFENVRFLNPKQLSFFIGKSAPYKCLEMSLLIWFSFTHIIWLFVLCYC